MEKRNEQITKTKEGNKYSFRFSFYCFLFFSSLSSFLVFVTLSSLLLTHFFLVCQKNPTAPETGTLTGTVLLEGQTDHSGITVALYPVR